MRRVTAFQPAKRVRYGLDVSNEWCYKSQHAEDASRAHPSSYWELSLRRTVGYLGDLSGQKSIFEKSTEVEHKVT